MYPNTQILILNFNCIELFFSRFFASILKDFGISDYRVMIFWLFWLTENVSLSYTTIYIKYILIYLSLKKLLLLWIIQ